MAQIFKTQGGVVNEDGLLMANQAEAAMADASSALVTFGYYTPVIVLMDESRNVLEENAQLISHEIQREGFETRVETINTMEAWLGALPAQLRPNVRRPLIHTLNLADLLPLATVWPGLDHNPAPSIRPALRRSCTRPHPARRRSGLICTSETLGTR
jgi:type IV secretory pathway VirB4 component